MHTATTRQQLDQGYTCEAAAAALAFSFVAGGAARVAGTLLERYDTAVPCCAPPPVLPQHTQMKRIFLEGNPYLLALTMAVSMLHSVFDFLAFKNDIGFWKENKSMEGLSARSIVINAFCQLVRPII